MKTPTPQVPWFKSQWFWSLVLLMIGLRLGYKYWWKEQRPGSETRLEKLEARNQRFRKQLRAAETASQVPVVLADSTGLADTTAGPR